MSGGQRWGIQTDDSDNALCRGMTILGKLQSLGWLTGREQAGGLPQSLRLESRAESDLGPESRAEVFPKLGDILRGPVRKDLWGQKMYLTSSWAVSSEVVSFFRGMEWKNFEKWSTMARMMECGTTGDQEQTKVAKALGGARVWDMGTYVTSLNVLFYIPVYSRQPKKVLDERNGTSHTRMAYGPSCELMDCSPVRETVTRIRFSTLGFQNGVVNRANYTRGGRMVSKVGSLPEDNCLERASGFILSEHWWQED